MRTLDEAVDLLEARGDAPAFRRRTEFRSFPVAGGEAARRTRRLAAVLASLGVARGDRVVMRGPNGPDWGLALLAVFRLGAVAVPLDARASLDFTRTIAAKTGARAAVLSRLGAPGPAELPTLLFEDIDARIAAERRPDPPPPGLDPGDAAEILFTSGTTGDPKGVVLTHGNIAANVTDLSHLVTLGPEAVFLSLLPLSHMFEQSVGFFLPLVGGATVVYLDTLKPSAIVGALRDERVAVVVLVPRILKGLMLGIRRRVEGGARGAMFRAAWAAAGPIPTALRRRVFGAVHRRFGGRIRFFVSAGAPLEPEVEAFWERLGFPVLQGWGLTETSPCLTCARPGDRRFGSVGRFLDTVRHRIGPEGEVLVQGPSVFGGYLDDPEKTREVFEDGWFRTGDLGELRDGHLYLKGRSKDLIKTPGGLNVYPEDVEAALRRVDGIRDACVFPFRGDRGEEVAAALLVEHGRTLDPQAAATEANRHLEEGRGVSRAFLWLDDDFPRTPTLKVRKFQVRAALEKGGGDAPTMDPSAAADPLTDLLAKLSRKPPESIADGLRLGADLGMDSLDLVDLVSAVEEQFRMDLDEGDVDTETPVGELRRMIRERKPLADEPLPTWPRSLPARFLRGMFRHLLFFPLFRLFVKVDAEGLENIRDLEGPLVFAPNHLSHLDTPAILGALPPHLLRRTGAAAWKEYFEPEDGGFVKRWWLAGVRTLLLLGLPMIPVAQTRGWRRSLRHLGSMLDAGWGFLFFPEGERRDDGVRVPFRQGVGILAGPMRATVVPVKVEGFHLLLPRNAFWPKRGRGRVVFGKPLRFPADADPALLTRKIEKAVDAL